MKLNITRGGQPAAPKLYVYGREGIGKTTFAAGCPKPLIIDIDGGAERYKADILKVSSVNELLDALSEVRNTSYKTIAIDTKPQNAGDSGASRSENRVRPRRRICHVRAESEPAYSESGYRIGGRCRFCYP